MRIEKEFEDNLGLDLFVELRSYAIGSKGVAFDPPPPSRPDGYIPVARCDIKFEQKYKKSF